MTFRAAAAFASFDPPQLSPPNCVLSVSKIESLVSRIVICIAPCAFPVCAFPCWSMSNGISKKRVGTATLRYHRGPSHWL
jgi:hypothetical protein